MNPPAEQLVRDYLNRLAVVARGRLEPKDLHALLEHTRTRIEAEVGGVARASAIVVQSVLAEIGDPAALVEMTRARLPGGPRPSEVAEATGSEARANGSPPLPRRVRKAPAVSASLPPAQRPPGPLAVVAASDPGPENRNGAAAPGGDLRPAIVPAQGTSPAETSQPPGRPVPGTPGISKAPPLSDPLESSGGSGSSRGTGTPPAPGSPAAAAGGSRAAKPAAKAAAPAAAVPSAQVEVARRGDRVAGAAKPAVQSVGRRAKALGIAVRKHKLEAVAIVLMGAGGAIYPPVWLLGVIVALFSKVFDRRDRWIGVGLPLLLAVLGAVLEVIIGGHRSPITEYFYEAWLAVGRVFRVMAVLGAGYLLRPLHRGRQGPRHPHWYHPPNRKR